MKNFYNLLLTLLLLSLSSCYTHERDCKNFKTGTFEFTQTINGKKETTTFVRTDSLQIETYKGKTDTATVRWVNDCEYIVKKLHPKSRADKKGIVMRILSTTADGYIFDYGFVGDGTKQRGEVKQLNK